jgi:AcrR family transcriptional regulator
MVRPSHTDPPAPRAQVIAAATRLFAARGFDGTPLQAIADELGVTKAAVLHHFPAKELLRAAVLDSIVAHWQALFPQLLLKATAAENRFEAVYGELQRFFQSDPDRARLVVREALDRPAELRRLLRGPLRPWLSAVAGYITDGKERGRHYADLDPELYVVHILMMVIAASGMADVCTTAVDSSDARGRYHRELARIARSSLFPPDRPGHRARLEKPKTRTRR